MADKLTADGTNDGWRWATEPTRYWVWLDRAQAAVDAARKDRGEAIKHAQRLNAEQDAVGNALDEVFPGWGGTEEYVDAIHALAKERDEALQRAERAQRLLMQDLKKRTERPDFKTYIEIKHGTAGAILWALQNGEVSRGKAAEALAEWAHGVEPQLPDLPDAIPDDVTPLDLLRERDEARAELAAIHEALDGVFPDWSEDGGPDDPPLAAADAIREHNICLRAMYDEARKQRDEARARAEEETDKAWCALLADPTAARIQSSGRAREVCIAMAKATAAAEEEAKRTIQMLNGFVDEACSEAGAARAEAKRLREALEVAIDWIDLGHGGDDDWRLAHEALCRPAQPAAPATKQPERTK